MKLPITNQFSRPFLVSLAALAILAGGVTWQAYVYNESMRRAATHAHMDKHETRETKYMRSVDQRTALAVSKLDITSSGILAARILSQAQYFATGAIGEAGTYPEEAWAAATLVREKDGRTVLTRLASMDEAPVESKLYAICGLQRIDSSEARRLLTALQKSKPDVRVMSGCLVYEEPLNHVSIIKDLEGSSIAVLSMGSQMISANSYQARKARGQLSRFGYDQVTTETD